MKRWINMAIVFMLATTAFLTACGTSGRGNSSGQNLVEVVRADLEVTVNGTGTIEIAEERNLGFGTAGRIAGLYVAEGDSVKRGMELARLDDSALELAVVQAEASVTAARVARDEAEYNLKQLKDVLHASNDRIEIAEAQLSAAEEQVKVAERSVVEARKQLEEVKIVSPFTGTVVNVNANEGDYISAGTPIITLIDPTSLELMIDVDELDVARVQLGQKAIIDVDALAGELLDGQVSRISAISKKSAGVVFYEVVIAVDSPETHNLKGGMSASADIVIDRQENVLVVPNRAISSDSNGNLTVKVSVAKKFEERQILTGMKNDELTEVLDGLAAGEMVLVPE